MAKIGFLGAGNMGIGIASRLLEAGHTVQVYNRTRSKLVPLVERGAVAKTSAREAAEFADAIFAMVGDDDASQAVWLGDEGALAATNSSNKPLIIECSTLSHSWVMELSKIVAGRGLQYLDCPVTGLPEAALSGTLTLFLGGAKSVISKAQDYLRPVSSKQIHFGEIGAGTAYKLVVNLMGSIQIAATAEALLVAERAGLDPKMVAEALGTGGAGSPQVANNSKLMVAGDHEANVLFSSNWRLKDTRYGVDFARELGQESILGAVAQELFQQLVDAGFADSAESKIIDILRAQ
jgi:3-hydroxyisobutyrate dehydrogenase